MATISYDDNIRNNMVDHDGTLKSNWPDFGKLKDRPTRTFWAVDVDGETFATGKDLKIMADLARKLKGALRHVTITEESLRLDTIKRREARL
jgi:hypothetical protein